MTTASQPDWWNKVVSAAWCDDAFKQRLMADPIAALREHGLEFAPEIQIRVVENTDQDFHLVLPPKPNEGELSDDDLDRASGGLVVTAIIGVLIGMLYPSVQKRPRNPEKH